MYSIPSSERKCYLLHAVGTRFTHVVTADTDGIKSRHVAGTECDDVGDNAH